MPDAPCDLHVVVGLPHGVTFAAFDSFVCQVRRDTERLQRVNTAELDGRNFSKPTNPRDATLGIVSESNDLLVVFGGAPMRRARGHFLPLLPDCRTDREASIAVDLLQRPLSNRLRDSRKARLLGRR